MNNEACDPGDSEMVRKVVAGDVNAFEYLVKKYQDYVLRIVKKHIPYDQVKDTTQEVFIRTYQSLQAFKGDSSFERWLSTIAIRSCYDFWRKRYKSRELVMSSLSEGQEIWLEKAMSDRAIQSFDQKGLQKEVREILDWALERISAEDRMVLELVYLEGHSVKEAAALLGWSTANVRVRSFRSRKKLQKLLTKRSGHGRSGT